MTDKPQNGDIVERLPGVYFEWHETTNSWIRLNGFMSIGVATSISDGLMPKEDFLKLQKLLTAPPKTTLTSVQCDTTFDGGSIDLVSNDFSLSIEDFLDLNENENVVRQPWRIHEDTWGFNFRINLNFLVKEMEERGNLIADTVVGPSGLPGERGKPGTDKLDTGPKGEDGESGSNAPFLGDLVNSSQFSIKDKSRVVVDVTTEKVSQDENYLVVHKGMISPENLCTRKVDVDNGTSSWVLIRNGTGIDCGNGCIRCDKVSYFDLDLLVDSIKTHVDYLIGEAKTSREEKALEWTRTMMKVFNEQKGALCCALENCKSRSRNESERKYIESSRITAAAAGLKLVVSSEDEDKVDIGMDEQKPNCIEITEVIPGNPNPSPSP